MKVLFVCTGNICRSPMGELLFPHFFHTNGIETDSAGTQGLVDSPIDPSSAKLMALDGIDSSQFRSKRLTPQLAMSSDLILCFTEHQRRKIVALAPRVRSKTFLLSDFANLCRYFGQNNLLHGSNVDDRMREVMCNASMARRALPEAEDIADPTARSLRRSAAHDQIGYAIADIAQALEPSRAGHATE